MFAGSPAGGGVAATRPQRRRRCRRRSRIDRSPRARGRRRRTASEVIMRMGNSPGMSCLSALFGPNPAWRKPYQRRYELSIAVRQHPWRGLGAGGAILPSWSCREALGNGRGDERGHVAAQERDLAHEVGRDMPDMRRSGDEHRLNIREHGPVHARHLHLVVEIGAVAQAAEDHAGAVAARGLDREVAEGDDLDRGTRRLGDRLSSRRRASRRAPHRRTSAPWRDARRCR